MLAQGVLHAGGKGADGLVVKVDVRERGEKPVGEQLRDLTRMLAFLLADLCEADQAADKDILQMRRRGLLAAYAGADAAAAAGGLLALKAKHIGHGNTSLIW